MCIHTYIHAYIHTMEYHSTMKSNIFESVLMRWMNLEPIIQNEASQKEKDKYFVLMHLYEIQKDSANNQGNKGDRDVKNSILDSVGEGKCGKI